MASQSNFDNSHIAWLTRKKSNASNKEKWLKGSIREERKGGTGEIHESRSKQKYQRSDGKEGRKEGRMEATTRLFKEVGFQPCETYSRHGKTAVSSAHWQRFWSRITNARDHGRNMMAMGSEWCQQEFRGLLSLYIHFLIFFIFIYFHILWGGQNLLF